MPSLGFGIERLGLPAARWPRTVLTILALVTAIAAFGIPRLETDDALSELFRSNAPDYLDYKTMSARFPASEFDVLVVVEGQSLMRPEAIETIRLLHLELEFADAVAGVLSFLSMRDQPGASGFPPPIVPDAIPRGPAFDRLMQRVLDHPLIRGKFLSVGSGGSDLTILVLSLKQDVVASKGLSASIAEIESIARETLRGTGLRVSLSGAPVMQLEIRNAILRDRIIYNIVGFVVGFLICLAFFRRLSLVIIASLCPVISVVLALGLLGLAGQKLNTFINVIPTLVMVIAFSDAMHMVFSVRRQLREGGTAGEAARHAVRVIGPACVLTSLTTSLALLSLVLTDSALIRDFGFASAFATLLAFVSVILVVPALSVLWFHDGEAFRRGERGRERGLAWLDRGCESFAHWVERHHARVAVTGIALVLAFSIMHLQLAPHYRLSDQVPDNKQSVATSERLDAKLTGAHPLHIMIRYPEGRRLVSEEVLSVVGAAHDLLERHPKVGNVWSLVSLQRWLESVGKGDGETLSRYLQRLPHHLTGRFVNRDARSVLVTGRLPNLDADEAVPVMRDLQKRLQVLEQRHPGYEFTVTGLVAVSALRSAHMIGQLDRGLLIAIVVVIALIGFAMRSLRFALLATVPNLFPIVTAGAMLYVTDHGLEYASVIALTVAFGLAVDDTIHFLARLRLEERRLADTPAAVIASVARIGPVLILTTLVLVVGFVATMASDLPAMRLFGMLTMTTLLAALVGDVVFLPAIVLFALRLAPRRKEA